MLHDGVGGLYSSSASFQSLLANISAAQHSVHSLPGSKPPPLHPDFLSNTNVTSSPPISPGVSATKSNNGGSSPPTDLRSSSIAALRLKAREHELRLEMLRQNTNSDLIS